MAEAPSFYRRIAPGTTGTPCSKCGELLYVGKTRGGVAVFLECRGDGGRRPTPDAAGFGRVHAPRCPDLFTQPAPEVVS